MKIKTGKSYVSDIRAAINCPRRQGGPAFFFLSEKRGSALPGSLILEDQVEYLRVRIGGLGKTALFSLLFFGGGFTMSGYIKLFREIREDWAWQVKPYSPGQVWVDILLMANYADKKVPFDGGFFEVKRGQFVTSFRKLGMLWGWSRTKVINFLTNLENDNKIAVFSDTKKTVITVINYDKWQGGEDTKMTQKRHRKDTEETQKSLTNNIKNNKKEEEEEIYVQLADRVVEYFRQVTGKQIEFNERNRGIIITRLKKRLKENKTMEEIEIEMKHAISAMSSIWKGDERMNQFLRLTTLIEREKYHDYIKEPIRVKTKSPQVGAANQPEEEQIRRFGGGK